MNVQVRANLENSPEYGPLPPEPVLHDDEDAGEEVAVGKIKGHWNVRLNSFQKLIFIKSFKEEKVLKSLLI